MTWARPALMALAWLFMIFVFIQFFLGGLIVFAGEDSGPHETVGYPVLHILPILMIVMAVVGKMGKKLIGMTVALLVLIFIQPIWAALETDSEWINAIHVPFALVIAALGYHVAEAATRAYKSTDKAF